VIGDGAGGCLVGTAVEVGAGEGDAGVALLEPPGESGDVEDASALLAAASAVAELAGEGRGAGRFKRAQRARGELRDRGR
jgi:hypothetical protein